MKCPKCGYISFDYLETCRNCGCQQTKNNQETSPPTKTIEPLSRKSYEAPPDSIPKIDQIVKNEEHGEDSPKNVSSHPESCETNESEKIESAKNLPKGGFWKRLIAFGLDIFLISLLQLPLSFAVKLGFITTSKIMAFTTETFFDLRESVIRIIGCILIAIYFIYFHGSTGQTPGKWALHLKVIRKDGKPLGYIGSIKRFLGYFISAILFNVGFIMIAFNKQKQALHDLIAYTYVIKT